MLFTDLFDATLPATLAPIVCDQRGVTAVDQPQNNADVRGSERKGP